MSDERVRPPTMGRVVVLYLACAVSGSLVASVLRIAGFSELVGPVVRGSLFIPLLLPVVYWADHKVFTKEYWQIRSDVWIGIVAMAFVQLLIETRSSYVPINGYQVFSAIAFGPFVEELARAAMIPPLIDRIGTVLAVFATGIMWASLHPHFWIALVQQIALSGIFVLTKKSLPATIGAHMAMNIVVLSHFQLHGVLGQ